MYSGMIMKALVDIGQSPDDCWNWMGTINKNTGYGKKTVNGKAELAHRWVYQQFLGPIPEGMVINHKCSNRRCVNPHHLEVTDQAGNCRHGAGSKLTEDQVREIKRAKQSKKWGDGKRLSEKYGVSSALIHDIWNGRAWKGIEA
jgi:hypothetical protein